jgi:hypothetical protein
VLFRDPLPQNAIAGTVAVAAEFDKVDGVAVEYGIVVADQGLVVVARHLPRPTLLRAPGARVHELPLPEPLLLPRQLPPIAQDVGENLCMLHIRFTLQRHSARLGGGFPVVANGVVLAEVGRRK